MLPTWKRYRPRVAVELGVNLVLVVTLAAGLTAIVHGSTAGMIAGTIALTLCAVQAILLFHDCMHQSAFGRRKVDTWVARAIGAFYGVPFHFLRHEHLSHHRRAGLVDGDPEALHPTEADADRRPLGRLLAHVAHGGGDAFLYTWILQFGQFARFLRRPTDRALLRATLIDVACMLGFWVPFTAFLVAHGAYLRVLVLGFAIPAVAGLALVYEVAKPLHTLMIPFRLDGMSYADRQFAVARSFHTHPLVGWLVCHLNFHLEHHLYPHVSRWDLPRLAREVRADLRRHAQARDLPLAIHDGYLSWRRAYQSTLYNPIARWQDWWRHNRVFDYVDVHAPREERPS